MTTIIKDDNATVVEKVRVEDDSSQMGWAVAVIVLVLVIIAGGYAWAHYHHAAAAPANPGSSTNINVTLPGGTNNTAPAGGSAAQ